MVGAPRDNTAAGGDAGSAALAVLDQAPPAAPDTYLVEDGNPLIVEAAQGVLANDTDLDGDALTAALVDPPGGGLELQADGSFRYVPDPTAKNSRVTFTYRVTDGLADSPGEVTIMSAPKQAAPSAQPTLPVTGSRAGQWTLVAVALLATGGVLRAFAPATRRHLHLP